MAMRIVGPIEALGGAWGPRHWLSKTLGTPARIRFLVKLVSISTDCAILAKLKGNPELRMPEATVLAIAVANGFRSEDGFDTRQLIKAIEAATAVRQNEMAQADPEEV